MGKAVVITEKPSQAFDYMKALRQNCDEGGDGYKESEDYIFTWCVGHLVTMSYPDVYDAKMKKWEMSLLPFIPEEFKYEVISNVKNQFQTIKKILKRRDIDVVYWAGDSGREGQYIEELVIMMCGESLLKGKVQKRVWIDSTTEKEILRGIREAKDMAEYKALGQAGFLRAQEDYLMGINFSRALTLKYGDALSSSSGVRKILAEKKRKSAVIAVGRVMSCVLGMVVEREEQIKNFKETVFYRIVGSVDGENLEMEWTPTEGSAYDQSPMLYHNKGFLRQEDARKFIETLSPEGTIKSLDQKLEQKAAPLLYNLAELQNECSKGLKISPDQTLATVQSLYEKKMTTYPRTDARVLSTAVAEVVTNNLSGLVNLPQFGKYASEALNKADKIKKSRYVDDSKITDHYAIIPTGENISEYDNLSVTEQAVYDLIVKRFLAIFMDSAMYEKTKLVATTGREQFVFTRKALAKPGYLELYGQEEKKNTLHALNLKEGQSIHFSEFTVKEGQTKPPARYNSGSLILAMENAGQLIEDEELRAQIKSSGVGTSATRAATLTKLDNIGYIALNKKTQTVTPTALGYAIYVVLAKSVPQMLNPKLTANWEKGLEQVKDEVISPEVYRTKMYDFIREKTETIKKLDNINDVVRICKNIG